MNRFIPDSLLEALLRPFAMAAPNGWVYIEVMAPDLRFLFLALLVVALLALAWKRRDPQPVTWALLAFLVVAIVPWLATSGNGRYFFPGLMLAGVLCVAVARALPVTRNLRLALVGLMLALQGFALFQNNPWLPWNSWGFADWEDRGYYPVVLDREAREEPATYVTVSVISYSLLAPKFPAQSHWINLSAFPDLGEESRQVRIAHAMLASAQRLRVLLPATGLPGTAEGLPTQAALSAFDELLLPHHLRLEPGAACRLLPVRSDQRVMESSQDEAQEAGTRAAPGFWVCAIRYDPGLRQQKPVEPRALQVFAVLERQCPRLFEPGKTKAMQLPSAVMRHYQASDMKVYYRADGVYYKYHRALNLVRVGSVDEVLAPGFTMRCDQVPGRSGLPWDRDI